MFESDVKPVQLLDLDRRKEGIGFNIVTSRKPNREDPLLSSGFKNSSKEYISVANGPLAALHNAAHLYSDQANPFMMIQRRLEPANSSLGARHPSH